MFNFRNAYAALDISSSEAFYESGAIYLLYSADESQKSEKH